MNRNRDIWNGFVAIEGIDGAGTTTLSRNLTAALEGLGARVVSGCEPTDGPIGRLIRDGLSGRTPLSHRSLALLFSADRGEHLHAPGGISSALDSGAIYLTDRYLFSSLAYQGLHSRWEWVDGLNADHPLPSHLIYLGLPPREAMDRISGRGEMDIFETLELQERVSGAYRRALDEYSDSGMRILEVDSTQSPDETCREATEFLAELAASRQID